GGRDFLIELGGEDLVAPFVLMGERRFMAMRLGAVFRLGGIGQVFRRLHRLVALDLLAFIGFGSGFGGGAFSILARVLVFTILVLAFGIFAFRIFVGAGFAVTRIAQREMAQQGAGQARESLLVAQGAAQLCQIAARLGLDGGAPQLHGAGQRGRRLLAGQL